MDLSHGHFYKTIEEAKHYFICLIRPRRITKILFVGNRPRRIKKSYSSGIIPNE